jgi:hypothetical protein
MVGDRKSNELGSEAEVKGADDRGWNERYPSRLEIKIDQEGKKSNVLLQMDGP